jgi:Zn-dependent M28 family amino/carboxypeptidase
MELGRDEPAPILKDQAVMVSGHLDRWVSGTGAIDNGTGSMVATRPHYS